MPDDLAALFTAPLPGHPPTREKAGLSTAPDTAGLARPTGKVNKSDGPELNGRTLGNVPYPRNDDGAAPVAVVLGKTISGCPAEFANVWLAGNGVIGGVPPARLAVTDFKSRRVAAATQLQNEAGEIAELFKRGK